MRSESQTTTVLQDLESLLHPFLQVISPWMEAERLCPLLNSPSKEKAGAQDGS